MKLVSNIKQRCKAPALARGLDIMSLLTKYGPLSLKKLSAISRIPKASLLRLLETLEFKGYVERDPLNKLYTNKVVFVHADKNKDFMEKIAVFLRNLSRRTSRTVEFYTPEQNYLKITARHECESRTITVKANLGFVRHLDGEFEAVARTAHAFSGLPSCRFTNKLWRYKDGKKYKITCDEYNKLIEQLRKDLKTIDLEFNSNGVRRSAAPIFQNRIFVGVVALAENFFPNGNRESIKNLAILKQDSIIFSKNTELIGS